MRRWFVGMAALSLLAVLAPLFIWSSGHTRTRREAAEARCDRMIEAFPADPGDEDVAAIARGQCVGLWGKWPSIIPGDVAESCAARWRTFGPNHDVGMTRCVFFEAD